MFRYLISISHFLDFHKKEKNGQKSIFAITTFLSISAFDFFLLLKQAFLKNPLLKITVSCEKLKLSCGKRPHKNYLKTNAWGVVASLLGVILTEFLTKLKGTNFYRIFSQKYPKLSPKSTETYIDLFEKTLYAYLKLQMR